MPTRDIIHATTQFWGGDPAIRDRYQDGRNCVLCGGPLTDRATGRLCRACNNKKKSTKVQTRTQRFLRNARRKQVEAWFENVDPPVSLRVVGVTLWGEDDKKAFEFCTSQHSGRPGESEYTVSAY